MFIVSGSIDPSRLSKVLKCILDRKSETIFLLAEPFELFFEVIMAENMRSSVVSNSVTKLLFDL